MRKTAIALLALGLVAVMTAPAFAASFWSETFSYADGGIVTVSGGLWALHSGTVTDVQVVNGEARLLPANANDNNRSFIARDALATTYAAFKMRVGPIVPTTAAYFAHFKDSGTFNFAARVWVQPNGTTQFNLGISSASTTVTYWATPLDLGTNYNVAIKWDGTAGTATLWVNPVNEGSASIVPTPLGTLPSTWAISAFALRQANNYGEVFVDNLGVGDTFTDAFIAGPTPVEGTTWGKLKALYR